MVGKEEEISAQAKPSMNSASCLRFATKLPLEGQGDGQTHTQIGLQCQHPGPPMADTGLRGCLDE